jgi:hypothetical protein
LSEVTQKRTDPSKASKLPKSPPKHFDVLQLFDAQLQVVANVKTKLVTFEVQKDTFFDAVELQSVKFQDYKVNLKDAMGCLRNNNEKIRKIGDFALTFLQITLNLGGGGGGNRKHFSNFKMWFKYC